MRVYLLVLVLAAAVTFLSIPAVRVLARRVHAVTPLRERDVHSVPTPRLGGLAMYIGFVIALLVASRTAFLGDVFTVNTQAWAIIGAAGFVMALGAADDVWDLDWITKLVGQILAAGIMVWGGVQLVTVPLFGLSLISSQMSLAISVVVVVVAINAVNFVDGLDGLAAGMVAIGGSAFFVYSYLLTVNSETDYSDLATMVIAALVGACLGFLPHNFRPATIFMGDSGAMFLGLVLAGAAIVVTGNIDPASTARTVALPALLPLILPVAVLLVPLTDFVLAVVRRLAAGKSPMAADGQHLHHRLLQLGHSHRRAVALLYLWTAIFAFGTVGFAFVQPTTMWLVLGCAVVLGLVLTFVPVRVRMRSRHVRS